MFTYAVAELQHKVEYSRSKYVRLQVLTCVKNSGWYSVGWRRERIRLRSPHRSIQRHFRWVFRWSLVRTPTTAPRFINARPNCKAAGLVSSPPAKRLNAIQPLTQPGTSVVAGGDNNNGRVVVFESAGKAGKKKTSIIHLASASLASDVTSPLQNHQFFSILVSQTASPKTI
jgi:hypothetical protein